MNCTVCGRTNESVDPGHDDGWKSVSDDLNNKEWSCPDCITEFTCQRCGSEMEEHFVKEDLVESQLITVVQMTCSYCGLSEIRYTIEEKDDAQQ